MKKEEKENIKKNNNKKLILIIIILIVIILLLLSNTAFGIFNNNLRPTGNINIFEIKTLCPDKNCYWDEPVIGDDNNVVAFDRYTTFADAPLKIFTDPAYAFREKIAPSSTNSYIFKIKINADVNVKYNLEFKEKNEHKINMQFKLKMNGKYIYGSDSEFVKINTFDIKDIYLEVEEDTDYELIWKWVESKNDTKIGTIDNAKYGLSITMMAIEVI